MELLVLVLAFAIGVSSAPQGYFPYPGSPFLPRRCLPDQVLHVDGRCVTPRVNRRVFLFDAPKTTYSSTAILDRPVERNFVFINAPEDSPKLDSIFVPPPRQEHVLYILQKDLRTDQQVVEVPAPVSAPEVYFVNYEYEEDQILTEGEDSQTNTGSLSDIDIRANLENEGDLGDLSNLQINDGFVDIDGVQSDINPTASDGFAVTDAFTDHSGSVSNEGLFFNSDFSTGNTDVNDGFIDSSGSVGNNNDFRNNNNDFRNSNNDFRSNNNDFGSNDGFISNDSITVADGHTDNNNDPRSTDDFTVNEGLPVSNDFTGNLGLPITDSFIGD